MSAPTRDHAAETVAGALTGAVLAAIGWCVGAWDFLPREWTWGAGWWAPIIVCAVVGAVIGRTKG